jgi:hypothetical protein
MSATVDLPEIAWSVRQLGLGLGESGHWCICSEMALCPHSRSLANKDAAQCIEGLLRGSRIAALGHLANGRSGPIALIRCPKRHARLIRPRQARTL